MQRLSQFVISHRRAVMVFWLLVTVVGAASVSSATSALSQEFTVPGREASETNAAIAQAYGAGGNRPPVVPVVTLAKGTTVDSPGVKQELDTAFSSVAK